MSEITSNDKRVMRRCMSLADDDSLQPNMRVNYEFGLILGVAEFTQEQHYFLNKDYLHNRALHGYGTVSGLRVTTETIEGGDVKITVHPGIGIDQLGRTFIIKEKQCADLKAWISKQPRNEFGHQPGETKRVFVVAAYDECEDLLVPIAGQPCSSSEQQEAASRIRDSYNLSLVSRRPVMKEWEAAREFADLMSKVRIVRHLPQRLSSERKIIKLLNLIHRPLKYQERYEAFVHGMDDDSDDADHPPQGGFRPLQLPAKNIAATLDRIFTHWITRVRPRFKPNLIDPRAGLGEDEQPDPSILLFTIAFKLNRAGDAIDVELVGDQPGDRNRPYLLSTQSIQQLMLLGGPDDVNIGQDFATLHVADAFHVYAWIHLPERVTLPAPDPENPEANPGFKLIVNNTEIPAAATHLPNLKNVILLRTPHAIPAQARVEVHFDLRVAQLSFDDDEGGLFTVPAPFPTVPTQPIPFEPVPPGELPVDLGDIVVRPPGSEPPPADPPPEDTGPTPIIPEPPLVIPEIPPTPGVVPIQPGDPEPFPILPDQPPLATPEFPLGPGVRPPLDDVQPETPLETLPPALPFQPLQPVLSESIINLNRTFDRASGLPDSERSEALESLRDRLAAIHELQDKRETISLLEAINVFGYRFFGREGRWIKVYTFADNLAHVTDLATVETVYHEDGIALLLWLHRADPVELNDQAVTLERFASGEYEALTIQVVQEEAGVPVYTIRVEEELNPNDLLRIRIDTSHVMVGQQPLARRIHNRQRNLHGFDRQRRVVLYHRIDPPPETGPDINFQQIIKEINRRVQTRIESLRTLPLVTITPWADEENMAGAELWFHLDLAGHVYAGRPNNIALKIWAELEDQLQDVPFELEEVKQNVYRARFDFTVAQLRELIQAGELSPYLRFVFLLEETIVVIGDEERSLRQMMEDFQIKFEGSFVDDEEFERALVVYHRLPLMMGGLRDG